MTRSAAPSRRPGDTALACALLVALALAAWLDRGRVVYADEAAVFAAIWVGIQIIGQALGAIGGAIAVSLEAVVGYLATAVSWLAHRVADVTLSTGTVFARTWDGLKIVWSDVLRPALVFLDDWVKRIQAWLKTTFAPVFTWLSRVRDYLNDVYKRFVRPVIDTIEFVRQLNRVLLTFHITLLQQLDATLAELERRIEEPILWVYARLTEVQNAVNFIVTADGLFQRLTLIKSMSHYAPAWVNGFWNTQVNRQALADAAAGRVGAPAAIGPEQYGADLSAFYADGVGPYAEPINEAASLYLAASGAPAL